MSDAITHLRQLMNAYFPKHALNEKGLRALNDSLQEIADSVVADLTSQQGRNDTQGTQDKKHPREQ